MPRLAVAANAAPDRAPALALDVREPATSLSCAELQSVMLSSAREPNRRNAMLQRAIAACLVACLALALTTAHAAAQEATRVRFTLDWKVQGPHAWFYLARDKGYFREAGLDVVVDQGEGSAATVTRIMSGAYDAGFGDINAIIQNAATRPGEQPVMVYMIYNRPPFALIVKANGPIRTLKDLEGRSLGVPAGSATHRMLTPLAKRNGVDDGKIKVVNVAPNLVEQMLTQGQVDSIGAFAATSYMNFVAQRQDPEKDFRWFFYDDYGLDLYSNGVMVSQRLVKEQPEAVRGLVRAINRAVIEVAGDPGAGMTVLARVEPLLQPEIELPRLQYFLEKQMMTPETRVLGIGAIDDKRMANAIATVTDAYQLARQPAVAEVFISSFLPPRAERILEIRGR
jgi:NitT/TauT family transport system substrate-binding protein